MPRTRGAIQKRIVSRNDELEQFKQMLESVESQQKTRIYNLRAALKNLSAKWN
jgi:hypothetical protein